jgi:drug/metabolite transporter (DMT)-like permease
MKGAVAVAIAILGVVLVTDPNLLLAPGAQRGNIGDLLSLVSGVLAGFAVVVIRQLRQSENSYSIFFYFNLVGLPVALLVMAVTHTPFLVPTLAQSLWLLLMGVASVGAQLLMTYGFRDLSAAEGSLISLTSILYSALISWAVFQAAITLYTAIGGTLILFASWLMTRAR